jgi:hypothetical protein
VLPIVTYQTLSARGIGIVAALLLSGIWPVGELGLHVARHRRVDELSIIALILLALSVISFLAFNSARLILVKESAVTGLFGLVLLASLAMPRPLMFYFGRKFATDGTAEGVARWDGLWAYPSFRRAQRVLTLVWGLAFLTEAAVRIALSYTLSIGTMVAVSTVLPYAVIAGLTFWTVGYGRRVRARSAVAAGVSGRGSHPPPAITGGG